MVEHRRFPFLLVMGVAAALVAVVLYPLWKPLFLGGVLASALWRVQERIATWLRGHRGVAATVITVTGVILLLGPIASVVVIAARQALDAAIALRRLVATEDLARQIAQLPAPLAYVLEHLRQLLPPLTPGELGGDLSEKLLQGSEWAAGLAGGALKLTSQLGFQLAIMLVTMHVLLIDGQRAVLWLVDVSPLPRSETHSLLLEFRKATRAILTSTLATAAAQGVLAMVGYLIASAPRPVFFGILTFMCAFIPGVGTALVALPMAAWLFVSGHHASSIFLIVYFVLIVSMVDNLLKPFLMKSGMQMHGAVVFLSLVGGVLSLGPVGLVAGPLALTFFLAMIRLREPGQIA